ncbi:MAG: hypothetical protein JNJ57_19355 [Saprospiraceae bacterium]|nr:hypothetical protein [Saprospiraceae bacterium]
MKSNTFIVFLTTLPLGLFSQQVSPIWQYQTNDYANGFIEIGPKIKITNDHMVANFGHIYSPGPLIGIATRKFSPQGDLLWEQTHQYIGQDYLLSSAVDQVGAVYIAGTTQPDPFFPINQRLLIKYAPDGQIEWQKVAPPEPATTGYIMDLKIDQNNDLVAFGEYLDTIKQISGVFIRKLAPDGAELWTKRFSHDSISFGALSGTWLNDRWIIWCRYFSYFPIETRFLCWQVDANGETITTAVSNVFPFLLKPIHIDQSGNLCADIDMQYHVWKFGTNAQLQWEVLRTYGVFPDGEMYDAISDEQSNTYIVGYVRKSLSDVDGYVEKIGPDGQTIWLHNLEDEGIQFASAQNIFRLDDHYLLAIGTKSINLDSSFYEPFFAIYTLDGYQSFHLTDLLGNKNKIYDLAIDRPFIYGTGHSSAFLADKQFLAKFSLSDLVSADLPEKDTQTDTLELWPNPFYEQVTPTLVSHSGGATRLKVFNQMGMQVAEQMKEVTKGRSTFTFNQTSTWPPGMYNFVLSFEDGRQYVARGIKPF